MCGSLSFSVMALLLCSYAIAIATTVEAATVHLADQSAQLDLPSEVYWSEDLETRRKTLFSDEQRKTFIANARTQKVVGLHKGCGTLKNRLALLEDGTKICCRYRDSPNELRGDLYSYYFNNLLRLWNVPPTTVVAVDYNSKQWENVLNEVELAGWEDGSDVIMVLFIEDLQGTNIPRALKADSSLLTRETVQNLTVEEQLHLMEWTDMVIFDFVIGHTDRLFNSLLNLQWNRHMMDKFVHNLEKTQHGKLVLIDNESGFWVGYASARKKPANYNLQVLFLQRLCIFRRSTVERLTWLYQSGQGDVLLEQLIQKEDNQSYNALRKLNLREREDFRSRLATVYDRIQQCSN